MLTRSLLTATILYAVSTTAYSWTIDTHFNDGVIGEKAEDSGDAFHGAAGGSTYSTDQKLKEQAARLEIEEGETGFGKWGGEFFFPETGTGETIWFLVHTYFPEDFDHYSYGEGGRLKFLRIQTLSDAGSNNGYNDLYVNTQGADAPFRWIYEGDQQWSDVGYPEDLIVKDTWESYQMAVTLDDVPFDEGGLAEIKIWKNGELLNHITDRKTLKSDTDYSNRALLFTYWNGGAPQTQHMYVDEVIITNETPSTVDSNGFPLLQSLNSNKPSLGAVTKDVNN